MARNAVRTGRRNPGRTKGTTKYSGRKVRVVLNDACEVCPVGGMAAAGDDTGATRFAERWAGQLDVDWAPLEEGLHEFDGYCDCEIVTNAGPEVVFR